VQHWQTVLGGNAAHYTTAADFRRALADAIDADRVAEFRSQFRGYRLLAIDDLHRLPSSGFLMQELRYTLDEIEETGGLLVVTTHRSAETLSNLPPDLRGRLAAGLSLQLAPPGAAARVRIIRHVSNALGREVSDATVNKMAEASACTPVQIFGELFDRWSVAPESIATAANKRLPAAQRRKPALPEIIAAVAKYSRVPQKELKSASRKHRLVSARAIAVYLARELANASYEQIGRALGGRDHSTIMHNFKKIERELATDLATQEAIADLRRILTHC
jgi:chromosomal replication initiator protein